MVEVEEEEEVGRWRISLGLRGEEKALTPCRWYSCSSSIY